MNYQTAVDLLNEDDAKHDEDENQGKIGVWMRRRRVDGALNRVPVDFYPKLWQIFEKV